VAAAFGVTSEAARSQSPSDPMASFLLYNGRIWTNDPARPAATALLIRGQRIAWVGEADSAPDEAGSARRIDLGGRAVVPGFNDAHTHFFDGGFSLLAPNTLASDTPEEFVRRLGDHAASLPEGRWINFAAAWDHERWPGHRLPDRWTVTSDSPTLARSSAPASTATRPIRPGAPSIATRRPASPPGSCATRED
jgi:hypothetical protein